jgi:hypothetical protein
MGFSLFVSPAKRGFIMSHTFFWKANFHFFLSSIDQDLANQTQQQGCLECGQKLHQANYPRSPVGIPIQFRDHYDERLSFCCDTCRKRMTPPSVKFFGRRWYPAPLFILISAFMRGVTEYHLDQMKRHFGLTVSESTWKRWRGWWQETFMTTLFWKQAKGMVPKALETNRSFPRALLDVFQGTLEEKMCFLLRFLSPLTRGVLQAI